MAADPDPIRVKCPWCAELILPEARVCRYCGRDLAPDWATETLQARVAEAKRLSRAAIDLCETSPLYDEALGLLDQAIALDPTVSDYHAYRSFCLRKARKATLALEAADQAVALNPRSARAFRQRGYAHEALDQWAFAIEDFTLAFALDPNHPDAVVHRARDRYILKQYATAEQELNDFLAKHPDQWVAQAMISLCAGQQSSIANPRLLEMVDGLARVYDQGRDQINQAYVASQLASILWGKLKYFLDFCEQRNRQQIFGDQPATGTGTYPQTAGQKLSQDLGQALAFAILYGGKLKEQEKIFTELFVRYLRDALLRGTELAWAMDQDKDVAQNLERLGSNIEGTPHLNKEPVKAYLTRLAPIRRQIWTRYPVLWSD